MWITRGKASADNERELERILDTIDRWSDCQIRYQPVFGGISNSNWRVKVNDEEQDYFVKIPGAGTEMFINRKAANEASIKAHQCGYGAPVVDFIDEEGVEIFRFVDGYRTSTNLDFIDKTIRTNAVHALKAFNDSGLLSLTQTVFDITREHFDQVEELHCHKPADFDWMHRCFLEAEAAIDASGLDLAPCMNDTLAGNFLIGADKSILLVDFEYATNNDRAYELALWFGEMFYSKDVERELIEEYYGVWTHALDARVRVFKALADLKWSTWSMVQEKVSVLDFDYRKYGTWKHNRARDLFRHPDWPEWLGAL